MNHIYDSYSVNSVIYAKLGNTVNSQPDDHKNKVLTTLGIIQPGLETSHLSWKLAQLSWISTKLSKLYQEISSMFA